LTAAEWAVSYQPSAFSQKSNSMKFSAQSFPCCRLWLGAVAIAMAAGCTGSQGPSTVGVSGTVTQNATPLEGANVVFHPVDDSANALVSQAVTDAAGRFELATHVGGGKFKPGIVPGKYLVAITKLDIAAITNTHAPPQNVLPKKYGDPTTSALTANVVAGKENDFSFNLSAN
jgi:hypothetical protein